MLDFRGERRSDHLIKYFKLKCVDIQMKAEFDYSIIQIGQLQTRIVQKQNKTSPFVAHCNSISANEIMQFLQRVMVAFNTIRVNIRHH